MNRFSTALALLLLACTSNAYAFSISNMGGKEVKWSVNSIDYYLDSDGFSGISGDADRQVCIQSFEEWDAISCSSLTITKVGDTTVTTVVPTGAQPNGKNEIIWDEGSWPFGDYVLGVTSPLFGYDGVIIEADVAFSGVLNWVTSGADYYYSMDVKSVAIHEFGHIFGVQHNLEFDEWDPPTMAPYVNDQGKSATLADDDMDCLCYLYPSSAYTCSSDSQCPYVVALDSNDEEYYAAKYKCSGGKCIWGTSYSLSGQKDLGGTCSEQWQCKAPAFCLPSSTEFCTRWCSEAAADCPSGFTCASIDSGPDGLCIKNGMTGSVTLGGSCWASVECQAGYYCQEWYSGGFCTLPCNDPTGGTGCPSGYTCGASEVSSTGAGCYKGSSSKSELGELCGSDGDCKSGLCFANPTDGVKRCRQACNPLASSCSSDQRCIASLSDPSGTSGACVPLSALPQIPNGVACTKNWECQSNRCFLDPETNESLCRTFCNTSTSGCPSGYLCVADAEGIGGCVPGPNAPLGAGSTCAHGYDCQSGYCVTLPGAQKKYCRDDCSQSKACPNGTRCVYYETTDSGYCMPSATETGSVCSAANECTTYICWSPTGVGKCREPCAAGVCPVGNICNPLTAFGAVCTPVDSTEKYDDGVGCNADDQCKSGICMAGRCSPECEVTSPNCPAGSGCAPLADGNRGGCTVPGSGELGASCETDFDCASLLCVELSASGRICVAPCSDSAPCGTPGKECVQIPELGGLGACVTQGAGEDIDYPSDDVVAQDDTTAPESDVHEAKSSGTCSASPSANGSSALQVALLLLFAVASLGLLRRSLRVS